MKTTQTTVKYIEWISPEDMHNDSKDWLSQLNFIKDEYLFFEHLITSLSNELSTLNDFLADKELIDILNKSHKKVLQLIAAVVKHEKALQIMLDEINQPKDEKNYKETHRKLAVEVHEFLGEHYNLKTQFFDILTKMKKEEKLQHSLDKRH